MKSRDGWLLAMVTMPLAALVVLLVAASITWKQNSEAVDLELVERFGREIATAPAPMEIEFKSTSTDQSNAFAEMLRCAEAIEAKHSYLIQFEFDRKDINASDNLKLERVFRDFAWDLKPLLTTMDAIDFGADPIWTPVEHGRPDAWAGSISQLRTVWRLLRTDTLATVNGGDNDRAIDSLERLMAIATMPLKPSSLSTELTRIDGQEQIHAAIGLVLPSTSWTPQQLQRLDSLLGQTLPFQDYWKQTLRSEQLVAIRRLRGDIPARPLYYPDSTRLAPSQQLEWLKYHQQLDSYASGSPTKLVSRLNGSSDQVPTVGLGRLDTLVSFPFAASGPVVDSADNRLADAFMHLENERKFYRTAVALLRYRDQFGEFPERLSELTQLGFPAPEMTAMNEWQFGYHVEETVRLVNTGRGDGWDGRFGPLENVIEFDYTASQANTDQ